MRIKTLLSTLIMVSSLTGCGSQKATYNLDLKVLSPYFAPAVAMHSFATEANYETTSNPKEGLIPNFKKENYDILVAPTNGGLMQIKQGANYKIAATITFGNFYIVSSSKDSDGVLNAGDTIFAYQETDIPGQIFKYLYGELGLDITWGGNVDTTKAVIENYFSLKIDETTTKQFDYVFTSEPVVTTTNSTVYKNCQEDFKTKSNGNELTQASIFVKNTADKDKVDAFLNQVEKSINSALNNPELIKNAIEKLGFESEQLNKFGITALDAYNCTKANNGLGLGFKRAKDIKNGIQSFVNLLTGNKYGELSEEVIYQ